MKLFTTPTHYIDTSEPLDISLRLSDTPQNVRAWYVEPPRFEPVRTANYVGSVAEGGSVNFRDIFFNPHGHGTHTECLGHISKTVHPVNETLTNYFFNAILVSVSPIEFETNDLIITKALIDAELGSRKCEALIIRTLPNEASKCSKNYASTNPPYLSLDVMESLDRAGVKHLLIDLPSVDREEDDGILAFHHAFWNVPTNPQFDKTITELIYVSDTISDGEYILELQVANFSNDAAPSRPVLYKQKRAD